MPVQKTIENGTRGYLFKVLFGMVVVLLAGLILGPPLEAQQELGGMLVLKHRIGVISLSEIAKDKKVASLIFETTDPLIYFRKEGVVMEMDDWASLTELSKREFAKSDFLRVVELPRVPTKKTVEENRPEYVIVLSYGVADKGRRIYIRMIEASSGQSMFSMDAGGADFGIAMREIMTGLEDWLLTQAWRCRVIGTQQREAVIDRGWLDGLREGVQLIGYSIQGAPADIHEPDEAILLKYGTRIGTYTVVEVRNNFAKVRGGAEEKPLHEGDILEMPEVRMPERDVKTRGSRIWDKVYQK